jgi:hypothetical protein
MISQMITPHAIQQIDPISSALSSLSASSFSSLIASLDEIVRKDLEAFRAELFWCLVAATMAVVVGVILEEAQEWTPTGKWALRLDPITEYRWAKKLVKLGWILIVVGVAGEGIFEVLVTRADGILGTFDNILLTEARREASDAVLGAATANIQVAGARQRTAQLEKEAAQLRKDAEGLKAENLKLEAIVAPRSLSLDQQRRIADACRKFHGHGVLVKSYAMDGEATALAGQLIAILRAANVVVADSTGTEVITGGFDTGVRVRAPILEFAFASTLTNALSSIGQLNVSLNDPEPKSGGTMSAGGQTFTNPRAVFVTLTVGIKPLPILPAK